MTLDVSLDNPLNLAEWLDSKEAATLQRHLEEKIVQMLFSQDAPSFETMVTRLAWLGSQPEQKPFLEREIIALRQLNDVEKCGLWKDVCKAGKKVRDFVADHAWEIGIGAAVCATGVGLAYVTGYALTATIGGVVVAGAGSVFLAETAPKVPSIPLPDPQACSKEEFAALHPPKVELPSSVHELFVTPNGIWANGQFFSTDALMKHSTFQPYINVPSIRRLFSSHTAPRASHSHLTNL